MSTMSTIQIVLMVKNAGNIIKKVIKSWKKVSTVLIVLDTGSTDGTLKLIKETCKKYDVDLYIKETKFIDFETSRNEMLLFAESVMQITGLTHNLVIDDSYFFTGSASKLKEFVKNKTGLFQVSIKSPQNHIYKNPRICTAGHRYVGKIHEHIEDNGTVYEVPINVLLIHDRAPEEHYKRSLKRFYEYDLPILENKTDPRSVYYKACTWKNINNNFFREKGHFDPVLMKKALDVLNERVKMDDNDNEEKFMCYLHMGEYYYVQGEYKKAYVCFSVGAQVFPNRSGEMFYRMYMINRDPQLIKDAYQIPLLQHRLQVSMEIYNELIPKLYNELVNNK